MKTAQKYGENADRSLGMWVKLARASLTFGKLTFKHISTFGLTEPQFGVLEVLGHLGPLTFTDLSRKRLVSSGNMTCVVDNLEKEGLVERVRNTEDRREILVSLTSKGKKLFDEVFIQHAEYVVKIASVLTPDEQETLSLLLKKLGLSLAEQFRSDLS